MISFARCNVGSLEASIFADTSDYLRVCGHSGSQIEARVRNRAIADRGKWSKKRSRPSLLLQLGAWVQP